MLRNNGGLFSVPAPPTYASERRGFLLPRMTEISAAFHDFHMAAQWQWSICCTGYRMLECHGRSSSSATRTFHKAPGFTGNQAVARILGVDFGEATLSTLEDRCLRARGDLVATYGEAAPQRLRSQIYWRLLPAAEFASGSGRARCSCL